MGFFLGPASEVIVCETLNPWKSTAIIVILLFSSPEEVMFVIQLQYLYPPWRTSSTFPQNCMLISFSSLRPYFFRLVMRGQLSGLILSFSWKTTSPYYAGRWWEERSVEGALSDFSREIELGRVSCRCLPCTGWPKKTTMSILWKVWRNCANISEENRNESSSPFK